MGTGVRWTYVLYIFSAHGHIMFRVGLLTVGLCPLCLAVLYSHLFYLLDIYVSAHGHFTQSIPYYHLPYYDYASYISLSLVSELD